MGILTGPPCISQSVNTFLGSNIFGLVYFNLFSGRKDTTTTAKKAEREEKQI